MAEETDPVDFWKGFAMGSLVGLIAAAYARGDFKRLLSFAPCEAEIPEAAGAFREHDRTLTMRREAPENAAIPPGSRPRSEPRLRGSQSSDSPEIPARI